MKFKSNKCIAAHVLDIKKAERFYKEILGFKLKSKTHESLEFNSGHFLFYVNKDKRKRSPIPSLTVRNIAEARKLLVKNGCKIIQDRGSSLYFVDPFGFTFDVIEG
jgi:catechol 2,3-dioxygenase-like lactoylglutathione lyase family enzyme